MPLKIPDFLLLEDRLDHSLERDIVKIEHVRMRVAHEPVNAELIDMELIELKFNFDRCMCFELYYNASSLI
jgi:N-terminal acetyltransferase B complex non-catalytic subunit